MKLRVKFRFAPTEVLASGEQPIFAHAKIAQLSWSIFVTIVMLQSRYKRNEIST